MNIKELDSTYVAHSYGRFPLLLDHGKGAELFDEKGARYIDMGSGIAVNTFGACDEVWQQAVIAQLGKLQHMSNLYYTQPCALLAQRLRFTLWWRKTPHAAEKLSPRATPTEFMPTTAEAHALRSGALQQEKPLR